MQFPIMQICDFHIHSQYTCEATVCQYNKIYTGEPYTHNGNATTIVGVLHGNSNTCSTKLGRNVQQQNSCTSFNYSLKVLRLKS